MANYDASPAWLKQHGLRAKDARLLERALCILADYEGPLKLALAEVGDGASDHDHSHVCSAIRYLIDGH